MDERAGDRLQGRGGAGRGGAGRGARAPAAAASRGGMCRPRTRHLSVRGFTCWAGVHTSKMPHDVQHGQHSTAAFMKIQPEHFSHLLLGCRRWYLL